MNHTYDVFISHKKEQLSWAMRLQSTLELLGYRVFVDQSTHDNLQAEKDWEAQLHKHCTESTSMVVLWSKKIGTGSFVHQEIKWRLEAFHANPIRQIVLLPLDELDEAPLSLELKEYYGKRQAFRGFIDLYKSIVADSTRDSGAENIEHFMWLDTARRFIQSTFPDAASRIIEIPFVVAAMTRKQADELVHKQNLVVNGECFDKLMGIAKSTGSFDVAHYGETPEEWRPLPKMNQYHWNASSINEVLARHEQERQNYVRRNRVFLNGNEYKLNRMFVPYTSQIAGTDEQRIMAIQRLEKRPCLVFIDPISLMHRSVRRIYDTTSRGLEYVFNIGMSPFIPVLHQDFKEYLLQEPDLIEELGLMTSYDRFHTFFNDALKASIMSVDHGYELTRWVQFATDNIARYVSERPNEQWGGNPNVRTGPALPPTF